MTNKNYEDLISQWHKDRNLIDGSTDKDQYLKLIQEAGELSDNICKGKDIKDDIGDMMVVLINIMVRNNLTINQCLAKAYEDIKDRKGKMIDGVFVKDGILNSKTTVISKMKFIIIFCVYLFSSSPAISDENINLIQISEGFMNLGV